MSGGREVEVVVLGAGMAGLTCARALAERGVRVAVIEARERVGGRIASVDVAGQETVELGAEFVHGRPAELWALIDEAGCETYERTGRHVVSRDGGMVERGDAMSDAFGPLDALKEFDGADVSFAKNLDREQVRGAARETALNYVEGFNAADATVVSARALGVQQAAEDATEGDHLFRVRGGYERLPKYLAARVVELGGEIRTGLRVRKVSWRSGDVVASTDAGDVVAGKAVVTLPLGVLTHGDVVFSPEPWEILAAARELRMGQVCRLTMRFDACFWETLEPAADMRELSFLHAPGEVLPVWWTTYPERSTTLTGWVGGPRAERLLGLSAEELGNIGTKVLAQALHVGEALVRGRMEACYAHDWRADEFARGAYSYVSVGGAGASAAMSAPVAETLYFAGEHTDVTGHWGTVHGAMRSGLRAAEQVLGDL